MRLSLNLQRVSFYVREQIRAVPSTVDLGNLQLNVEPVAVTLARSPARKGARRAGTCARKLTDFSISAAGGTYGQR